MTKKRLVSAILALVMITVVLPCSAIAEADSPLSALTVGETELTVSQDDLTTGWTGSTGWKYYAGKYLALVDLKEGKDITAQGDLQLAMAGLNHITALESDADVHIFGTGILLLDDVGVEGTVTIDSQSAPAVFVLQEGTYQLQNPETAPAILDEAYTLPGGVNYLLPAGTSMKMVTTHFLEEGDHKYSAANLTVPAGVEMVVGGKLTIAVNFCSAMYAVSAANLHVKGKLTIKAGASVAIGGDITVENGGTLQCEEYITNGYHDTIWDDGQGVWYPGMVRLQSGKEQTVMLDGATVLVGCDTKLSSVTTKGNSILGVTGPYKVDISSLKAETGKLQVKGFNFYQNGTYGSIPKGYSAVSLERVSGDITLEAGQFTFSDKSYPSVSLRDDVGLMNVVGGSVGTTGNTGYLFTAHDGLQEKGRVSVYVDTAFTMRSALGYCETDSAEAQNKFHREMNLLGEDIQSYLVEDETTLLHQAGYDTLKDLVSVADFDPQAYGQMYTVVFQVVSYPGSEAGKAVAPLMTYITSDNGQKVDLNEVAVVRCVAQMQSIGSTLGSTTSTTNTSATGSGNLGGSDGGSLSTSGASTSLQLTSYTVSASAGTGGRVSPGGKTRVPKGGSLRISITPDSEYEIDKVTVDGTSIGAETSYTFSNVSGNHTISASFKQKVTATPTPTPVPTPTPSPVPTPTPAPTSTPTPVPTVTPTPTPTAKPTAAQSHSITTTAGTGGTVSPAGTASYATGSSLTVKIKAKDGYVISKVTVDGKSVGAVSSYTFKDINADHTLKATFEDDGYDPEPTGHTIYASAGNGGSISPSGSISCTTGTSRTFTISADNGYELVDVKIDGVSMGVMKSYTFKSINDSHTINASFKKTAAEEIPTQTVAPQQGMTYAITVTSGNGGSVSPDGNVLASQGGQQVFTIVPESGYVIDDVQVDGASVGAVSQYVMQDITRNHTVTATFKKSETARFAILLGEGTGGTISCQENVSTIPGGTTVVVTITPQEGFAIADVLVDDVSVGAVPQYTFSGVNANHTVNAVFMEKTVESVSRGGFPWVIVGGGLVILALAAVGVFALQYDRNRKH